MHDPSTSSSPLPSRSAEVNDSYLLRFVFVIFFALVVLRFLFTSTILNTMIGYTGDGGSPFEKLHFTTYGLFASTVLSLLTLRIKLTRWELDVVKSFMLLIAVIGAVAMILILSGRTTAAGYLADAYVVACLYGFTMFAFPPRWRELVGSGLILFVLLSAVVALGEFLVGTRLLPYPHQEEVFRPTGITSHPLQLGLFCATSIAFVPLTRWPAIAKVVAIALLLVCTFAAGARFASLVATASTFILVLTSQGARLTGRKGGEIKLLVTIAAVLAVPLFVFALVSMGVVERFERGLLDESAMARVNIYSLFELVEWRDILLGADIVQIQKLAAERLNLPYIESPVVVFVFHFGLIGAVLFVSALVRTFMVLLRGADRWAVFGTCAFFLIAASGNSLATKEPEVLLIMLLLIAFHRR